MLLETPQDFFKEINFHRLLSDLALQRSDVLGIQSGLRTRACAGKCQLSGLAVSEEGEALLLEACQVLAHVCTFGL